MLGDEELNGKLSENALEYSRNLTGIGRLTNSWILLRK